MKNHSDQGHAASNCGVRVSFLRVALSSLLLALFLPATAFAHVAQHSLFITTDGSLYAMGYNSSGQLGTGDERDLDFPTQIFSAGVVAASGGSQHSLILKSDGSLWVMGANNYGQLGTGDEYDLSVPTQILSSGVAAVAAGGNHSIFLKTDGSLWTMGENTEGQLGIDSYDPNSTPTEIVTSGVTAIARGGHHTLFIKEDGSLWGMGWNGFGQLGLGDTTNRLSPVQILESGVASVTAGNWHSLIVKTDGSLWAMGDNQYGQLGDGSGQGQDSPVKVLDSGVAAVSASGHHTLFIKTDGSLWAMGDNRDGQLGAGNAIQRDTPVEILPSGVISVTAEEYHSLILMANGSLWGMGNNRYGELGLSMKGGSDEIFDASFDKDVPTEIVSSWVNQLSEHPPLYLNIAEVTASDGATGDSFGLSVSQSGDLLAVGAPYADHGGLSSPGAVYVYQVDANGSTTSVAKVTASDATANVLFGGSVSLSGDLLAVGTPYDDHGGLISPGAVYVYQVDASGNSAAERVKITASDAAEDAYFGESVSLSGNLLAIGASGVTVDQQLDAGAVYLYQLDASGSPTYLAKLTASDPIASAYFGCSISQSGDVLAIGAAFADLGENSSAGAVYLYEVDDNGNSNFLSKVTADDASSYANFGGSVSQSGDRLAVGATGAGSSTEGATYLYRVESNGTASLLAKVLSPDGAAGDSFGNSVSQSGNLLAIGASDVNSSTGATYLYRVEEDDNVTHLAKLTDLSGVANDSFGKAISLSDDMLAVGANGVSSSTGKVSIFRADVWVASNQAPTAVVLSVTSVPENSPAGTVVGELSATDADPDDVHVFALADKNDYFAVDGNQLKTFAVLDYETYSTLSIRIIAIDQYGDSVETDFDIEIVDTFTAGVDTLAPTDVESTSATLRGQLLDDGDLSVIESGFVVSRQPDPVSGQEDVAIYLGEFTQESYEFSYSLGGLLSGANYYVRAYVTNAEGISYGEQVKFTAQTVSQDGLLADAVSVSDQPNWRESSWFGAFYQSSQNWIYHYDLGWLYLAGDNPQGVWVWSTRLGWLWTGESIYPYLYCHDESNWYLFLKTIGSTSVYFRYATYDWIEFGGGQ